MLKKLLHSSYCCSSAASSTRAVCIPDASDDVFLPTPPETMQAITTTPHSLPFYDWANSRRRRIVDLVAAAAGVETIYAPPAMVCEESCQPAVRRPALPRCHRSVYLLACLAVPDTGRVALDGHLAAECACVSRVLGDFDLLDLLAERGTVAVMQKEVHQYTIKASLCGWRRRCEGGRRLAYRVPYFPVMPTFFVRFVIAAVLSGWQGRSCVTMAA